MAGLLKPAAVILRTMVRLSKTGEASFFSQDDMREMVIESGEGWFGRAHAALTHDGLIQPARGMHDHWVVTRKGSETA